jgi:hypothetical protein
MNHNETFRRMKLIFDEWDNIALDIDIVCRVVECAHQRYIVVDLFRLDLYLFNLNDSVPW